MMKEAYSNETVRTSSTEMVNLSLADEEMAASDEGERVPCMSNVRIGSGRGFDDEENAADIELVEVKVAKSLSARNNKKGVSFAPPSTKSCGGGEINGDGGGCDDKGSTGCAPIRSIVNNYYDDDDDNESEDLLALYGYANRINGSGNFHSESGRRLSIFELTTMTESIYSIMYVSPAHLPSFGFAVFTFCFQAALIVLIFIDMIDFESRDNPLQIPPGVNEEVQIAEALAMMLAVATQEDMIVAVTKFIDGYKPSITRKFPHATYGKWLFSTILQFSIGIFVLLDTFVVVCQSGTVIEMMLNFAGLAFVSEIDDIAFLLAKHGFVTDCMQNLCQMIEKTPVPIEGAHNGTRRICYLVISASLFIGYGKLTYDQLSGKMVCQSIFVQFGDGFSPELPFFSGVYDLNKKNIFSKRVSYTETKQNSCATFAYCGEDEVWTLSIVGECSHDGQRDMSKHDPCNYYARSSKTGSYDIIDTASSPWFVKDTLSSNIAFQFDWFKITCNDCEEACSDSFGKCVKDNNNGVSQCVCNKDRYGLNCEFREPCPTLDLDLRTPPFETLGLGKIELSSKLELLKDNNDRVVEIYERPVYYNKQIYKGSIAVFTIIMFLGRRWVATFGNTFDVSSADIGFTAFHSNITKEYVLQFLSDFHAFESDYNALYLSDPMDIGTPSDSSSPDGLNWYKAEYITALDTHKPDLRQPIGTVLLCSQCTSWNICANFGNCHIDDENRIGNRGNDHSTSTNTTTTMGTRNMNASVPENIGGYCECWPGFGGALCELEYTCLQKECLNGGKCNKLTGVCQCPGEDVSGKICQFNTGGLKNN